MYVAAQKQQLEPTNYKNCENYKLHTPRWGLFTLNPQYKLQFHLLESVFSTVKFSGKPLPCGCGTDSTSSVNGILDSSGAGEDVVGKSGRGAVSPEEEYRNLDYTRTR